MIKEWFKKQGVWLVVLVVLVGAAFIVGRYTVKADVIVTEKVVVQTKTEVQIVEVEKKIIERVVDSQYSKNVHKERTEESRPDGTKLVKEVTDIGVEKTIKDVRVEFVDRTTTVEKTVEVEKIVEKEKIVKGHQPDWTVSVKLGTEFLHMKVEPTAPWLNPLIIGVGVDRRILGPFKMGLWADTDAKFSRLGGGLSVSGEF